jgi:hypothetical protein
MIRGRFGDTSGRPFIEGRLILKRLKIINDISFCIDTAADFTALLPGDSKLINLDYRQLKGNYPITGICGISNFFIEPAIIVFSDPGHFLYSYKIDLKIAPYDPDIIELPSVLGRDIWYRWDIRINTKKNLLAVKILEADYAIPIMATP